jgi:hypothetical protein
MFDIAGLPAGVTPTLADFAFRVTTTQTGGNLVTAPAPSEMGVRRGAGVNGSDRITFVWPDGSIVNRILQVTVLASPRTRLDIPDVFTFASLVGEASDNRVFPDPRTARVDAADVLAVRAAMSPRPVPVTSPADINRDGRVDARDLALVRARLVRTVAAATAAPLLPVPAGRTGPTRRAADYVLG